MDTMSRLYNSWNEMCSILGAGFGDIITNPFFWVIIFVLLCCVMLTYSGSAQNRLSGSIISTLRQLGMFFIDTINSIIQACKSLFGFLDVLRVLFFGHLGKGTLYVLTNYAIIFLSMASFATTLQGLNSLIGWTGILVSFGVQVMELITTTGIIICWVPAWGKLKETVKYTYCYTNDKGGTDQTESGSNIQSVMGGDTTADNERQEKIRFRWGRVRRAALPFILPIAYIASVFFSYCYMFDKVVMPEIAYDDYIESIGLVNNVTVRFEEELTVYRTELVNVLTYLNNAVIDASNLSEDNMSTLDTRIEDVQNQLESARRSVNANGELLSDLTAESENYAEIYDNYMIALENSTNIEANLADLRAQRDTAEYGLYQAVRLLTQFYGDPLYLMGGITVSEMDTGETGEEVETEDLKAQLNNAFNIVMIQGYTPHADQLNINPENIRTAFDNYTILCEYYAKHGGSGLDLVAGGEEESVAQLLAKRAEVLEQYEDSKSTDVKDSDKEESMKDAKTYLAGESGKLLVAAMYVLERVPRFSNVGEIVPETNIEKGIFLKEPNISEYLSELNEKYRSASGQLSLQEQAITKLFSEHSKMAWFCLVMALTLDGMIILLCFLRGREYYGNSARDYRQMISILFMISSTNEEREQNEQGRQMILAGTVLGCLVYLLYFAFLPGLNCDLALSLGQDSDSMGAMAAFVSIIGGIMLVTLLNAVRATIKKKDPLKENLIKERIFEDIYQLFSENLRIGFFRRECSVKRPKQAALQAMVVYNSWQERIWKILEDYKKKAFVLGRDDYETIITCADTDREFYILEEYIRARKLQFHFAILKSYGLVYHVTVPKWNEKMGVSAYLFTKECIRLIYECVLIRTVAGNSWEYTLEDDLLDYEREEDDD